MAHAKYSKFEERLRLMRINRLRKKKHNNDKNKQKPDSKTSIPLTVITTKNKDKKLNQVENKQQNNNKETKKIPMYNNLPKSHIKIKSKEPLSQYPSYHVKPKLIDTPKTEPRKNKQKELEKSIFLKLNMQIEKYTYELEIIEEIFTKTKDQSQDNVREEECKETLIIIQELQDRLNKIKEKFIRLTNYDCQYDLLEIENKSLYEDINLLENMINKNELNMSSIIQRINYYHNLYQDLEELNKNIEILFQEEQDKLDKYLERDKEFAFLEKESDILFKVTEEIISKIKEQDYMLESLNQLVTKIEKQEIEVTKLQEKTSHLFPSLKLLYLSLLFTKPFKNPLANVALQAIALRELFRPRKKYQPKKVKEIKYSAKDYSKEIVESITNLDNIETLIDNSLLNLQNFRKEFNDKYAMYISYLDEYQDLDAIFQELEDKLIHNKNKIKLLNEQFINTKKQNEDTLARVKKIS